jgi:hypothetical protein
MMPALTPAERQQRRRDKLAAARPPREDAILSPIETRMTRQEAWDEACDRLNTILETYRAWKLVNPTPAGDLSAAALPGLASQVLTLTLTTLALDWGCEWYFPPDQDPVADRPPMPARSLRELALGAPRLNEENEPRSTPEQDARARAWWTGMKADQRGNWQRMANCTEPEDVYHVLREMIDATCRLPQRFP